MHGTAFDPLSVLKDAPESFLRPSSSLRQNLSDLVELYVNPLAKHLAHAQALQPPVSRKRKRRSHGKHQDDERIAVKRIYTAGFEVEQVWQQAKLVLDFTAADINRDLVGRGENREQMIESASEAEVEADELEMQQEASEDALEDDQEEMSEDSSSDVFHDLPEFEEGEELDGEEEESELSEEDAEATTNGQPPQSNRQEQFVQDEFGLNDGFFSIDDFNKQSSRLERLDEAGEDDADQDDTAAIDWAADPLGYMMRMQDQDESGMNTRGGAYADESAEEDSDEDGPVFEDADLDAASDSDAGNEPPVDMLENSNGLMYADFFQPPVKAAKAKSKTRARQPKAQAAQEEEMHALGVDSDEELERTMSRTHRDLFDDESDSDEEEAEDRNLSTQEKREAALRAQIRTLEAANVAEKSWSLMGESMAPARPVNSLLEEHLDFERAGKPVPVITEAIHEEIEALIKRRILAQEFDEVIRRRPTDLVTRGTRIREPLSEAKPSLGLADEYEAAQQRLNDPNTLTARDTAVQAQHAAIAKDWAAISDQLDALCNWHYKPRAPSPEVSVRTNVARLTMEDAQPTAGDADLANDTFAAQEVYNPADGGKRAGEIVTRGGVAVAKDEMTREQRKRQRTRSKARGRKAQQTQPREKGAKASNAEVASQLRKGGVGVIDRSGTVRRETKAPGETAVLASGALKL